MRDKKEDIGYWAGCFVACGLSAGLFIFAVWRRDTLHSIACTPEETNCFRDWLAALGGWAAIAAAVPTVYLLSRQVRDATLFQRQNMQVQLRRSRAMAIQTVRAAQDIGKYAHSLVATWKAHPLTQKSGDPEFSDRITSLQTLKDQLSSETFKFFEKEITTRPVFPISYYLTMIDIYLQPANENPRRLLQSQEMLRRIFSEIIPWMSECEKGCKEFLWETDEYVGANTHG